MTKTTTMTLDEKEAYLVCDALNEAAIFLRTNHMTGVVMSESSFLSSDISEGKRRHYLMLKDRVAQLDDFIKGVK